jgi:[NiFe] hydrogenase assembly HybE family chaperone
MSQPLSHALSQALSPEDQAWVDALVQVHEQIARTSMAGLPVMHPGLQVASIGFDRHTQPNTPHEAPHHALVGILLTPWFMSLIWRASPGTQPPLAVGHKAEHPVGQTTLSFIGHQHELLGAYESCSLISPLLELPDQATAVDTAQAILAQLCSPAPAPAPAPAPEARPEPAPSRRAFLTGRRDTLAHR